MEKCSFPFFQDTPESAVWDLYEGGKDDFFVFDSKGTLHAFLPAHGEVSTQLSSAEGYANLKAAILSAISP